MSDESRAALEAAWEEAEAEAEDLPVETEEEETEETTDEVVADVEETDEPEEVAEEPDVVEASEDDEEEVEEPAETVEVKAPQSWRAAAREAWAEIPESARAEIEKREAEFEKKLGEISEKSARANAFEEAIAPFQQTIAIEANGDAIAATRNLMGVATRLRGGTQQEKAMVVRDIITQYGVDIATLDSALVGAESVPVSSGSPQPPPVADPRVEQMWNQQQQTRQQQQEEARNRATAFIESREFGVDVRESMADIIELSHKRGRPVTMEQAYERAVALDPEIQSIIAARSGQTSQSTSAESLKRKKRASTSIKGSPTGSSEPSKPTTRAGMLSQAWDSLASGGQ